MNKMLPYIKSWEFILLIHGHSILLFFCLHMQGSVLCNSLVIFNDVEHLQAYITAAMNTVP